MRAWFLHSTDSVGSSLLLLVHGLDRSTPGGQHGTRRAARPLTDHQELPLMSARQVHSVMKRDVAASGSCTRHRVFELDVSRYCSAESLHMHRLHVSSGQTGREQVTLPLELGRYGTILRVDRRACRGRRDASAMCFDSASWLLRACANGRGLSLWPAPPGTGSIRSMLAGMRHQTQRRFGGPGPRSAAPEMWDFRRGVGVHRRPRGVAGFERKC